MDLEDRSLVQSKFNKLVKECMEVVKKYDNWVNDRSYMAFHLEIAKFRDMLAKMQEK